MFYRLLLSSQARRKFFFILRRQISFHSVYIYKHVPRVCRSTCKTLYFSFKKDLHIHTDICSPRKRWKREVVGFSKIDLTRMVYVRLIYCIERIVDINYAWMTITLMWVLYTRELFATGPLCRKILLPILQYKCDKLMYNFSIFLSKKSNTVIFNNYVGLLWCLSSVMEGYKFMRRLVLVCCILTASCFKRTVYRFITFY